MYTAANNVAAILDGVLVSGDTTVYNDTTSTAIASGVQSQNSATLKTGKKFR